MILKHLFQHFFGVTRSFGRNRDHPDPLLFSQIFRLLSCYSLLKPPKGSNVEGGELLSSLVSSDDLFAQSKKDDISLFKLTVDRIIDNISVYDGPSKYSSGKVSHMNIYIVYEFITFFLRNYSNFD